jgi:hypothetical protein
MRVAIQRVAVGDLLPNPYRHSERYTYALSDEKIDALIQSYGQTGFWDGSIQARPDPKRQGKYQIAFGHHRVAAARKAEPPLKELGIVVGPRSDAEMLRMMADENRAEFKHDALVAVETIAAVIEAYGRGEIELEAVHPETAKSQTYHSEGIPTGKPYTVLTVARFLGWTKAKGTQANSGCRAAFDAYRERAATEEALNTIPQGQRTEVAVGVVVDAAKAARAEAQKLGLTPAKVRGAEVSAAKVAAKQVVESGGFKARDLSAGIGKSEARKAAEPKQKALPQIEVYAAKLIVKCEQVTTPYESILTQCRSLIPFVDDMDVKLARRVADALVEMLRRDAEAVRGVAAALRSSDGKALRKALEA